MQSVEKNTYPCIVSIDIAVDLKNNRMDVHENDVEPWKVILINAGEKTMTGGRLKRIKRFPFINITDLGSQWMPCVINHILKKYRILIKTRGEYDN